MRGTQINTDNENLNELGYLLIDSLIGVLGFFQFEIRISHFEIRFQSTGTASEPLGLAKETEPVLDSKR
jgi:hypothetical protein